MCKLKHGTIYIITNNAQWEAIMKASERQTKNCPIWKGEMSRILVHAVIQELDSRTFLV